LPFDMNRVGPSERKESLAELIKQVTILYNHHYEKFLKSSPAYERRFFSFPWAC